MENKITTLVKKFQVKIAFGAICFLSLLFLVFNGGTWSYLDLSYRAGILFENKLSISELFHNITDYTIFGYDNTQLFATRFINIFFEATLIKWLGSYSQLIYFVFYFGASFWLARRTLMFVFSRKAANLGAFVYTFNPVSLYLLNEAGFFFVYFSLPLIVYSFVQYFRSEKINYAQALLFGIGLSLLTSYARVSFVYFGIIIFLATVFYQALWKIFQEKRKKVFFLIGITFLILLPIFFSFIHPHLTGDSKYFSGISNYSKAYINSGEYMYRSHFNTNFFKGFILTELTPNFSLKWQTAALFQIFSLLFFGGGIIFSIFILRERKVGAMHFRLAWTFLVIVLGLIFLRTLAHFVEKDLFVKISYQYLPFMANTSSWIMIGLVSVFSGLLSFMFAYAGKKEKIGLLGLVVCYVLFSIWPLVFYKNNTKLKTISKKDIPSEYQLFSSGERREATLFFPDKNLYFQWSPYPVDISQGNFFKDVFSNNVRLVNEKQAKIYNYLNGSIDDRNLSNVYFFNLKNIFVFKDVRNSEEEFDFFPKKNYLQLSGSYYQKMKQSGNFTIEQDNEHFAHFVSQLREQADFFIYSPKTVVPVEVEDFFNQEQIDVERRALLLDGQAFKKPAYLPVDDLNQEVEIFSKLALNDATKYLVKLKGIEAGNPFLLQLNQTFGMSWKIKWVDREYFEKRQCLGEVKNFPLSGNASCLIESIGFGWDDISLLWTSEVNEEHHFEGNFVGNSWIVRSGDIPAEMRQSDELYAVIIYEKQLYYVLTLFLAGGTMLILLVLAGWNLGKNKWLQKNNG